MNTSFQAALFDLDGTLLDTIADIATAGNAALARLGFPGHDRGAYRRFVGAGRRVLAGRILPEEKRDDATVDRLVAMIGEEYNRHWADTTQPYPGIPEMLDALTRRRVRLAVLSNKAHPATQSMVARLLPRWRFEIVSGARPEMPLKPDPAAAREIARRMELPPERFLYLGDSDIDMKTARGAGMFAVAALWGYGEREDLQAAGAQSLAEAPDALLGLLR